MKLTRSEVTVLRRLAKEFGSIVSKNDLAAVLYTPENSPTPDSNCVEVFVRRIRTKIGNPKLIETRRNQGYFIPVEFSYLVSLILQENSTR